MSIVANPFDRFELFVGREFHETITSAVDRSDGRAPFRRQVDAWWLAMTIGVQRGQRKPLTAERVKFVEGTIFGSDPWRITHLQLLGLVWFGPDALGHPGDIVTAANEFANAGFDWVVETVSGQPNRTLAMYNGIAEVLVDD